jgi:signal transduction histidine kinase
MPVTLGSAGQVKPAVTTTTFRVVYSRVIEVEPVTDPAVYRVTINYELSDGSTVQANFRTDDDGLASADNTRIAAAKTAIKNIGYSAFARGKAGLPSGGTTT